MWYSLCVCPCCLNPLSLSTTKQCMYLCLDVVREKGLHSPRNTQTHNTGESGYTNTCESHAWILQPVYTEAEAQDRGPCINNKQQSVTNCLTAPSIRTPPSPLYLGQGIKAHLCWEKCTCENCPLNIYHLILSQSERHLNWKIFWETFKTWLDPHLCTMGGTNTSKKSSWPPFWPKKNLFNQQ